MWMEHVALHGASAVADAAAAEVADPPAAVADASAEVAFAPAEVGASERFADMPDNQLGLLEPVGAGIASPSVLEEGAGIASPSVLEEFEDGDDQVAEIISSDFEDTLVQGSQQYLDDEEEWTKLYQGL